MAMRLYTQEEFDDELENIWELTPTDQRTKTTRIWKTKSGHSLSVPQLPADERYPDYYIVAIVEQIKALEG